MSFKLKNVGATYQRMMNKVFKDQTRNMLEIYMDNVIVKSKNECSIFVRSSKKSEI